MGKFAMSAFVPPPTNFADLSYQAGAGNHFATEALPNSLPVAQNNPQQCAYGLYAEQLTGTAFTAPRATNQRTWMYRITPSVAHGRFSKLPGMEKTQFDTLEVDPNQMRWSPFEIPTDKEGGTNFVEGLQLLCGAGEASMKHGLAIYNYCCTKSMNRTVMGNADGDFLIVPQQGVLNIRTECGCVRVEPCEIIVIPRGIKFSVDLETDGPSRGYVLEVFKGHFEIPSLGPIGSNGLANPRDFEIPVAAFEDLDEQHVMVNKYSGTFFTCTIPNSPFNVVAWHGNYYPYKYDLRKFCTMNSVSFDHPDPSIYTVLTCQTDEPGTAVADFVIFPPRWMVMEKSFRPPYYHRNTMSEFMGMIHGQYDAKAGGFLPGGASLHSCMTPHGPDATTFQKASTAELKPEYFDGGLAFMFESAFQMKISHHAITCKERQHDYAKCWENLPKYFPTSVATSSST